MRIAPGKQVGERKQKRRKYKSARCLGSCSPHRWWCRIHARLEYFSAWSFFLIVPTLYFKRYRLTVRSPPSSAPNLQRLPVPVTGPSPSECKVRQMKVQSTEVRHGNIVVATTRHLRDQYVGVAQCIEPPLQTGHHTGHYSDGTVGCACLAQGGCRMADGRLGAKPRGNSYCERKRRPASRFPSRTARLYLCR